MKVGMNDERVATGLLIIFSISVAALLFCFDKANDYPKINSEQIDTINYQLEIKKDMEIRKSYDK